MVGIGRSRSSMHLEYACINMTSKPLIIICNITEDIAVLCYGSSRVPVKNGNINEGVSSSKNLHASSIHIHEFTPKRTKQSMKNWTRYSLSKIRKNESDRNHVTAESHEKDSKVTVSARRSPG